MALGSTNTYFLQDATRLKNNWVHIENDLKMFRFRNSEIEIIKDAYEYFKKNPTHYDGATHSQDLYDVPGLEIAAMLHDYIYVALRANRSVTAMRIADALMFETMRRMAKCGVQITWRRLRLPLIRLPFAIYNQIKHGADLNLTGLEKVKTAFAKS